MNLSYVLKKQSINKDGEGFQVGFNICHPDIIKNLTPAELGFFIVQPIVL